MLTKSVLFISRIGDFVFLRMHYDGLIRKKSAKMKDREKIKHGSITRSPRFFFQRSSKMNRRFFQKLLIPINRSIINTNVRNLKKLDSLPCCTAFLFFWKLLIIGIRVKFKRFSCKQFIFLTSLSVEYVQNNPKPKNDEIFKHRHDIILIHLHQNVGCVSNTLKLQLEGMEPEKIELKVYINS